MPIVNASAALLCNAAVAVVGAAQTNVAAALAGAASIEAGLLRSASCTMSGACDLRVANLDPPWFSADVQHVRLSAVDVQFVSMS